MRNTKYKANIPNINAAGIPNIINTITPKIHNNISVSILLFDF